jgi:hypothetical protein
MGVSKAWGYTFTFATSPGSVETFRRSGGRLLGAGSGRVSVRGPGGCHFKAKLPFSHPVCRPHRSH